MNSKGFEALLPTVARLDDDDQERIDRALEEIIRVELSRDPETCMLARIGEFIERATWTLSKLTDRLVGGEHIQNEVDLQIQEMDNEDGFLDQEYFDYMGEKHRTLRTIKAKLQDTASEITKIWVASPSAPPRRRSRESMSSGAVTPKSFQTPIGGSWMKRKVPAVQVHALTSNFVTKTEPESDREDFNFGVKSPQNEDDSRGAINEMIANLSSRGKGRHICPLGTSCRKNGVDSKGEPIIFWRNSAFRAHLEKHGKRYKCSIPGCKNREGFARKDQLERHQKETVFHTKPK